MFGGLPCVPSAGLWAPFIANCPHVVSGTKTWFEGAAMARQSRTFARMPRRTCSTPTSFGRSPGRSWLRMDAHVMYLTQTWSRCVAKALVGSTIARMPRRDICWTQACFEGLKPSCVSLLLAECPPQERHGLPRIAGVAQAPDRRPLQDRTRRPPSRPDPSRGVLRRANRICRTFPRLFPRSTCCCYKLFCRSHGPAAGTVYAVGRTAPPAASRASTVVPATLFGPLLTGGRLDATQAVVLVRNAG